MTLKLAEKSVAKSRPSVLYGANLYVIHSVLKTFKYLLTKCVMIRFAVLMREKLNVMSLMRPVSSVQGV